MAESTINKFLGSKTAKKRMARILAVQAVYAHSSNNLQGDLHKLILGVIETYPQVFGEAKDFSDADEKLMITLTKTVFEKKEFIDELISKFLAKDWKLSRLGLLVQSILRVACAELICDPDLDRSVIHNEYLEITKIFNHDGEAGFVNSVLDQVAKSLDNRI